MKIYVIAYKFKLSEMCYKTQVKPCMLLKVVRCLYNKTFVQYMKTSQIVSLSHSSSTK